MAREYFCAYHSLLDTAKQLTDTEFGKLIRAALAYSRDHDVEPLRGREAIVWDMVKWQIDRDAEKYNAKCKTQRENVMKRWSDTTVYDSINGIPTDTNDTNTKTKAKAKTKAKDKESTKENENAPIAPKGAERFERFWKAYPKKVGKDVARRAFDKRNPSDGLVADMLVAIARQSCSQQWLRDGGQYIPNPATWLNQGRWQDEPIDATTGFDFRDMGGDL